MFGIEIAIARYPEEDLELRVRSLLKVERIGESREAGSPYPGTNHFLIS